MILDYVDNINAYGDNVVRLHDFNMAQAILFRDVLKETIVDSFQVLDLSTLEFIEKSSINLILRLAYEDEGIRTNDEQTFFCDMTMDSYKNMLKLIEPFCHKETRVYQYLYDVDSLTDFLFTPTGTWHIE